MPAGEHDAPLADIAVVAVGHLHDLVVDLGADGGLDNLRVRGIRAAVADVLADGAREEEDVLLDDPDIAPQARLRHFAHILPVHEQGAAGHVVKAGQEADHRGLAAAGGSDQGEALPRLEADAHMAQHREIGVVEEGHVAVLHLAAHLAQLPGVGGVGDGGLGVHDLEKSGEARHALHVHLGKLREAADGADKGRDIEGEGDEIDIVQLPLHDEQAAHRDDHHLGDAGGKLHAAHEARHGAVILRLRPAEEGVCGLELLTLLLLIGEGLGRADAGDGRLDGGGDLAGLALDLKIGLLHPYPLREGKPHAQTQHQAEGEGELPVDRQHHGKGTEKGQPADQQVLRPVVAQLRHVEEIGGDMAHQNAGAVPVEVGKAQLLHVLKEVAAHVGLGEHAHAVSEDGDEPEKPRLEHIGRRHQSHDPKEGGVAFIGQKPVHGQARDVGEHQVDERHENRAAHIQRKKPPMPRKVLRENLQGRGGIVDLFLHGITPDPGFSPPLGKPGYAYFSRSATAIWSQRLLYSLSAWPLTQW